MRRVRFIILGVGFRDGRVAELLDLKPEQVLAVGKYKKTVAARSLLCFWAWGLVGNKLKRIRAKAEDFATRSQFSG